MINKKFIVPIYESTVRLFIGNLEELQEYFSEIFGKYYSADLVNKFNLNKCYGKVADLEDGSYLIWLPYTPTTFQENGTLNHKIFHLAVSILLGRNIPLNETTEEAVAYLIEYLTKEILEMLGNDSEK